MCVCENGSIDVIIVVVGFNDVIGLNKIVQTLLLLFLLLLVMLLLPLMLVNNNTDTFSTTNHSSPALCRRAVRLALRHATSTALRLHSPLVPDVACIIMSAMPHITDQSHTTHNLLRLTVANVCVCAHACTTTTVTMITPGSQLQFH